MPKPTRRKTLSHHELENFLNEISTATTELNKQVDNFFNLEDIDDPILSGLAATPAPNNTTTTTTTTAAPASSLFAKRQSISPILEKTDADLVREYCKLQFQHKNNNNTINNANLCTSDYLPIKSKELAKQLYQNTKYKLITARLINPEEFLHPIESNEGKRSLIISLTPMLTDAEEQRKKDTQQCEQITRCKSNKIRGRSSYEYIDIDTYQKVEFEEFEMRYKLFINRNKPKQIHAQPPPPPQPTAVEAILPTPAPQSVLTVRSPNVSPTKSVAPQSGVVTVQPPLPQNAMEEEDKENSRIRANRTSPQSSTNVLGEVDKKSKKKAGDRKRKLLNQSNSGNNTRNNDRRGTLSPASARAMALQAMEEEEAQKAEDASTSSSTQPLTTPLKASTETSLQSLHGFEDIDLMSFRGAPHVATSYSTSSLFTVTEEEIALINGLSSSSSLPNLSPSQMIPTEPAQPHPKKRSPLLNRTPIKSPLVKLWEHLNDNHSTIPLITTPMGVQNNNSMIQHLVEKKQSPVHQIDFLDSTSYSSSSSSCSSVSVNEEELISTDYHNESDIIDEVGFISMMTSNHTRTLDFFDDSLLIPTNCSMSNTSSHCFKEGTENEERNAMMQSDLYLQNLPMTVDEQEWEIQAKKRLHERFMIARNQFQWELVSVQAANSAIIRIRTKRSTSSFSSIAASETPLCFF